MQHYDNCRDAFEHVPGVNAWHQINRDAYPHDTVLRENDQLLATNFTPPPASLMSYANSTRLPEVAWVPKPDTPRFGA